MNLPDSALSFLDVFIGLFSRSRAHASASASSAEGKNPPVPPTPRIHVYAFSKDADPILDVTRRAAETLRCDPVLLRLNEPFHGWKAAAGAGAEVVDRSSPDGVEQEEKWCRGHLVRDVSPNKMMVCLSFYLPIEVGMLFVNLQCQSIGVGRKSPLYLLNTTTPPVLLLLA